MIWKIWFYLYLFEFLFVSFTGNTKENIVAISVLSEFDLVTMAIFSCILAFLPIFILFSLAYKKRLFSLFCMKLFAFILPVSSILTAVFGCIMNREELLSKELPLEIFPFLVFVAAVISLIFLIPVFVGIYKYIKRFDSFKNVDKPYWKLFTVFCIHAFILFLADIFIFNFNGIVNYNVFDYIICASCLYEGIFLFGYSFNKKILPKLFWKISSIFYILTLPLFIFISDSLKENIGYLIFENFISVKLLTALVGVFMLYALYKYAFSKEA